MGKKPQETGRFLFHCITPRTGMSKRSLWGNTRATKLLIFIIYIYDITIAILYKSSFNPHFITHTEKAIGNTTGGG